MAAGEEVGLSPGSYRIIDLYCFREVLNQIMKCSCQSGSGFSIFQALGRDGASFHTVLDIVCRSCSQKVSFGTSTIVETFVSGALSKPDIDLRIENCFHSYEDNFTLIQRLRQSLHSAGREGREVESCREGQEEVKSPSPQKLLAATGEPGLARDLLLLQPGTHIGFTCNICNKEFKKSFNLKQHVRVHTNEKPLKCAQCEKRFNDRSSMNKHGRTVHADLRPYTCSLCEKCFTSSSHLKDHQVTHTNQKEFQCLQCGKSFAFRSSLNKHSLNHQRLNDRWNAGAGGKT